MIRRPWNPLRVVLLAVTFLALGTASSYVAQKSETRNALPAFTVVSARTDKTGAGAAATIQEAFRSDGSTARLVTVQWPAREQMPARLSEYRMVASVPNRLVSLLFVDDQAVSTFAMGESYADALSKVKRCESFLNQVSGHAEVSEHLGFRILGHKLEIPGEAAQSTVVQWVAPDLNCYPLRLTLRRTGSDGVEQVVSEVVATSIAVGEPASSLFEVPSDFAEMSPANAADNWVARTGAPFVEHGRTVQYLNNMYHAGVWR